MVRGPRASPQARGRRPLLRVIARSARGGAPLPTMRSPGVAAIRRLGTARPRSSECELGGVSSRWTTRKSASRLAGCLAKGWLQAGWERRLKAQTDHRGHKSCRTRGSRLARDEYRTSTPNGSCVAFRNAPASRRKAAADAPYACLSWTPTLLAQQAVGLRPCLRLYSYEAAATKESPQARSARRTHG